MQSSITFFVSSTRSHTLLHIICQHIICHNTLSVYFQITLDVDVKMSICLAISIHGQIRYGVLWS